MNNEYSNTSIGVIEPYMYEPIAGNSPRQTENSHSDEAGPEVTRVDRPVSEWSV